MSISEVVCECKGTRALECADTTVLGENIANSRTYNQIKQGGGLRRAEEKGKIFN